MKRRQNPMRNSVTRHVRNVAPVPYPSRPVPTRCSVAGFAFKPVVASISNVTQANARAPHLAGGR